ncbi:MAG TPA: SDR family NAD(P)-dependent oxidoreductase [Nocardioides sp.]|nr:SDR family NAD(P)-dependent oxidoreductase [Nocardioides sp.]
MNPAMDTLALVTGATRGLGLATARALAARGLTVLVGSRHLPDRERVAADLRAAGHRAEALELDVTDPAVVRTAAHRVECAHGRLDVLVNNAGVLPEAVAPATEVVDLGLFRQTFDTNLFGAVSVLEAFLPLLRRSDQPRVVNVSSTMGSLADQVDPDSPFYETVVPAYQASKAALNSVTIALAKRHAGTGMVATSVCPGFVRTGLAPAAADAPLSPEEAARVVVDAALAPAGAPSGRFVGLAGSVPW